MTPMSKVKLTNQSSDRQADDIDFIGPSVYGDSTYKGDLTISGQAYPCQTKPS